MLSFLFSRYPVFFSVSWPSFAQTPFPQCFSFARRAAAGRQVGFRASRFASYAAMTAAAGKQAANSAGADDEDAAAEELLAEGLARGGEGGARVPWRELVLEISEGPDGPVFEVTALPSGGSGRAGDPSVAVRAALAAGWDGSGPHPADRLQKGPKLFGFCTQTLRTALQVSPASPSSLCLAKSRTQFPYRCPPPPPPPSLPFPLVVSLSLTQRLPNADRCSRYSGWVGSAPPLPPLDAAQIRANKAAEAAKLKLPVGVAAVSLPPARDRCAVCAAADGALGRPTSQPGGWAANCAAASALSRGSHASRALTLVKARVALLPSLRPPMSEWDDNPFVQCDGCGILLHQAGSRATPKWGI